MPISTKFFVQLGRNEQSYRGPSSDASNKFRFISPSGFREEDSNVKRKQMTESDAKSSWPFGQVS